MKEIETNFIEKVIDIMKENELTEASLEDNECSLYIRTSGFTPVVELTDKKNNMQEEDLIQIDEEAPVLEKSKLVPIVSNMIGLYFSNLHQ